MTRLEAVRRWASLLACLVLTVSILAIPRAAHAATPIVGAGSTWSQIAVDQWRADVARYGVSVNYIGNGSSQGRAWFAGGQSDFAVSEIPYEGDESKPSRPFVYLPIVAGGTSLMYNLGGTNGQQIKDLNLSSSTAVGIFTGAITRWNDAAIVKENPKLKDLLPDAAIVPVVRSDGSGTSAQFSKYLSTMQRSAWSRFSKEDHVSYWPNFPGSVSQQGSDGVANFVANGSTGTNSITYVERGYATTRGFPVANLLNASGRYTQSEARNVAIALEHASFFKDGTQNLQGVYRAPESDAYAMSSYSYMIAPTKGFDPGKGETLGKFIIYFACQGQKQAESLGYSPLPVNLVENAFDAVRLIPGAPEPPSVDECGTKALAEDVLTDDPTSETTTDPTSTDTSEGPKIRGEKGGADTPAAELAAATDPTITSVTDPAVVLAAAQESKSPPLGPSLLAGAALLSVVFGPLLLKRRGH